MILLRVIESQLLIFKNQVMRGIFQFLETYVIYFEQFIHKVVLRFLFCWVYITLRIVITRPNC